MIEKDISATLPAFSARQYRKQIRIWAHTRPPDQQGRRLLHVTHGEYIAAKMRAKEALKESIAARDQPGLGGLLR